MVWLNVIFDWKSPDGNTKVVINENHYALILKELTQLEYKHTTETVDNIHCIHLDKFPDEVVGNIIYNAMDLETGTLDTEDVEEFPEEDEDSGPYDGEEDEEPEIGSPESDYYFGENGELCLQGDAYNSALREIEAINRS